MVKVFFKRISAFVLALCVIMLAVPMSSVVFADDFTSVNVLSSNVSAARCVQFYPSNHYVGDASHISAETIAKLTDGDKTTTYDCQTALDWDPPRYLGIEFTLDDTYYIGELKIYSGYTTSVDTFDVYASDSFDNLYNDESLVAAGVNCDNTAAQTLAVNRDIKYVTFLISGIELYCARIAEFEAWTAEEAGGSDPGGSGFVRENLMIEGVESITPVIKNISTGAVVEHNQFNGGGAVATLNDGNTGNNVDVYGANDWGNNSGVLIELKESAYCASLSIYSGFNDYPDTYDVYASDSLESLYAHPSLVGNGVVCKGGEQVVDINRTIKYVAVFLTDYVYNGRIAEIQLWTGEDSGSEEPQVENLLINHKSEAQCILYDKTAGTVTFNGKFDQNGALAPATDNNLEVHTDVWGWDANTGVGVQYTLDNLYTVDTIYAYSGFSNLPDAYRVFASDDLVTLYDETSMLCSNLECGGYIELEVNRPVRYVAFILDSDGGRVKEYQVLGVAKALPTFNSENVLTTASVKSVARYADGNVSYEEFITAETLAKFTDGDTVNHNDFNGTLEWDPPRAGGAEFTLGEAVNIGEIKLYASIGVDYPETYRVYASDDLETLYTDDNLLISGAQTTGNAITVDVNKEIQYIAFFCESYTGNPRFKEIEAYTACAHAETEVRGASEPTCTEPGSTGDTYCLVCSKKIAESSVIEALGHDYNPVVTDPTCTEAGYTTYTCSRCGDTYTGDETAALGHSGGTATCHSKAVCGTCGEEYGEFDPNNHEGETEVRNATEATCTEAGYTGDTYCLGCGAKLAEGEDIAALGHDFGEYVSDGNATCTADGTKTAKCSRCDATDTVDDVGSMLDHTVGVWIFDEVSHHRHCDMCDEDVDVGEHAYQWVVVTPATVDADGLKKEVCSICGYESGNEQPIPKLENHIPGDINGDGAVNNKDLTRLFQYLSDWDVQVTEAALDVNGDGNVNNKDLTRLFQYLSDWDVEIY